MENIMGVGSISNSGEFVWNTTGAGFLVWGDSAWSPWLPPSSTGGTNGTVLTQPIYGPIEITPVIQPLPVIDWDKFMLIPKPESLEQRKKFRRLIRPIRKEGEDNGS